MKRIIIHWSAGGHTPSNLDKEHYHYIIAGDGTVVPGKWPVAANEKPVKGKYAAHTLNCNTGSIGVAVAAMAGAVERPFNAGKAPITPAQVKALAALCRDLAAKHKIPVSRETILSHAEVQPTLGIKQRGKWDIAWLPGMKAPGDPVAVGDKIRAMIAGKKDAPIMTKTQPKPQQNKAVKPAIMTSPAKEMAKTAAGGATGAALVLMALLGDAWGKFVAFADWITFWNN
jgi:N-acetylmuramoyl-L-alanine amidase